MTNQDDVTRLDTEAARRCAFATRRRADSIAEKGDEGSFARAAYLHECAQIIDPDTPAEQRAHLAMIHAVMSASREGAESARMMAAVLVELVDDGARPPDAPEGEEGVMFAAAALIDPASNAGPSTWVIHNPEDWTTRPPNDDEPPTTRPPT